MSYKFKKSNRKVNRVFLHCTASDNPKHDNVKVIEGWHKAKGWSTTGYHLFIRKDGTIEEGRDLERIPASAKGHNTGTIAVVCHGLKREKFTQEQFNSIHELCNQINIAYDGQISFHGHAEVAANKTCPVYDYKGVLNLDGNGRMVVESKIGDRVLEIACAYGEDVKWVQDKLKCVVDGYFGSETNKAVKEFQENNGLELDSVIGYKTWEVLFDLFGYPNT